MNQISQLPSTLFWDTDISKLSWDKHQLLIVERVIERGSWKDFKLIEQEYGKEGMAAIIKNYPFSIQKK